MSNENKSATKSVSVFFPAYNDALSIGKLVADAFAILPDLADDYEVVVVDDGSEDETDRVLRALEREYARGKFRVVRHASNLGYGAALQSGFRAATKELVFYTDGDGQYDVSEMAKLFPLLTETVDVVNGFKLERGDRINRRIVGVFYNRLAHLFFRLPVRDVDCDFRLFRREFLEKITLTSTSGSICVELIYELNRVGARFAEIGVNHYTRPHGRSQFFTLARVSKTLLDFFAFRLRSK
jgi:glycosyltransferase involved in cell wall biosynthesis